MQAKVLQRLREAGYEGRIVSTERLPELEAEIGEGRGRGWIDEEVYQAYMTGFTFHPPESLPDARSLIVVSVPQPQIETTFQWGGKLVSAITPPTYLNASEVDGGVRNLLAQALEDDGYRVAEALVPKKLLAVRSGLAAYGKNNITYVPGMGSFHRLAAFYSDLPCPEHNWQEPQMMDACQKCSACLRRCPSGAISAERFQVRAERCITFHNEKDSSIPFPEWLDASWHEWLVGCMRCQLVCPENKDVVPWVVEGPHFPQEETALLVQGVQFEQLPAEAAEKLQQSEMIDIFEALARNLSLLLGQGAEKRTM